MRGLSASADHQRLEAAKWIALIAMTIDHYGNIVRPEIYTETHLIGRVAYPLFAWIVGTRLAWNPSLAGGYLKNLVVWALISQPFFVLAGREWWDGNILFTLALGVAAVSVLGGGRTDRFSRSSLARAIDLRGIGLAIAILALSIFTEYGPFGVAVVPAAAWITTRNATLGVWSAGPLGLLSNVVLWPPFLVAEDFAALFASLITVATTQLRIPLPRLPKYFFYAYYPSQLLAFHLLDLYG